MQPAAPPNAASNSRSQPEADRYFKKYYSDGDATAQRAFADALVDLKARIAVKAPYSATARAMLMGLRARTRSSIWFSRAHRSLTDHLMYGKLMNCISRNSI
jgi:hypothetical protein